MHRGFSACFLVDVSEYNNASKKFFAHWALIKYLENHLSAYLGGLIQRLFGGVR